MFGLKPPATSTNHNSSLLVRSEMIQPPIDSEGIRKKRKLQPTSGVTGVAESRTTLLWSTCGVFGLFAPPPVFQCTSWPHPNLHDFITRCANIRTVQRIPAQFNNAISQQQKTINVGHKWPIIVMIDVVTRTHWIPYVTYTFCIYKLNFDLLRTVKKYIYIPLNANSSTVLQRKLCVWMVVTVFI